MKSSSTICTAIGPCATDMLALFGLFGLFSATFLAARLIPAQSEAVLAGRRSWEMRWHAELPIFEYINGFYHP
jgi:membrane protein YqaA with SNARE-associated domain